MSDEQLILAYRDGDRTAFPEIFRRYAPFLRALLRSRVGDDADNLVQQTFLQLHMAAADFRAGLRFRPWIVTIALNLARDRVRRWVTRREVPLADALEAPVSPPDGDAVAALAHLGGSERNVIALHVIAGMSFDEVARAVGTTAGAARVRACRGYARLRSLLATA